MAKADYSHHVRAHPSRGMRVLFLLLGSLCALLGVIGLFVPLLPTTPFVLLAAACYARASHRVYNWLLNNPLFGPAILEWRLHRSIAYRTKLFAVATMAAALGISIIVFVDSPGWQMTWVIVGVALAVGLYRIPSRDAPQRRR